MAEDTLVKKNRGPRKDMQFNNVFFNKEKIKNIENFVSRNVAGRGMEAYYQLRIEIKELWAKQIHYLLRSGAFQKALYSNDQY